AEDAGGFDGVDVGAVNDPGGGRLFEPKVIRRGRGVDRSDGQRATHRRVGEDNAVAGGGKTGRDASAGVGGIDGVDDVLHGVQAAQIDREIRAVAAGDLNIGAGDGGDALAAVQFRKERAGAEAANAQIGRGGAAVFADGHLRSLHGIEDVDAGAIV